MGDMPIIRLEVDSMRHSLLTYLGKYHDDLQHHIEKELEKQIAAFDFGSLIEREAKFAIQKEIQDYFKYGDGAKVIRKIALESIAKFENKGENL